jgi:hypothetical protein
MGNSDSGTRKYTFPETIGETIEWRSWDAEGYERVRQAAHKYADRRGWKFSLSHAHGITSIRRMA